MIYLHLTRKGQEQASAHQSGHGGTLTMGAINDIFRTMDPTTLRFGMPSRITISRYPAIIHCKSKTYGAML